MIKFICQKCKSSKLGHQKWVRSCSPVKIHPNNHTEYEQAIINEDNELGGVDGFVCMDCGQELYFCGCRIQTEDELTSYLSLDQDKREEQEKLYQESVEEGIRHEEQREQDEIESYQTEELAETKN